jgi:regulatory protein
MKKPLRKIPTLSSLSNVALHYLGRYMASEASLRRVLTNRLRRVSMENPSFAADHDLQATLRSAIETIIERHIKAGALNDATFAETKIQSWRRQGRSKNAIKQRLALKGIPQSLIEQALVQSDEQNDGEEDAEWRAALALAKKRKIGPFGKQDAGVIKKKKDFGMLARAGFSSAIARRLLAYDPEEG